MLCLFPSVFYFAAFSRNFNLCSQIEVTVIANENLNGNTCYVVEVGAIGSVESVAIACCTQVPIQVSGIDVVIRHPQHPTMIGGMEWLGGGDEDHSKMPSIPDVKEGMSKFSITFDSEI